MNDIINFFLTYSAVIIPIIGLIAIVVTITLFIRSGRRNRVSNEKAKIVDLLNLIHNNRITLTFGNWSPNSNGGSGGSGRMLELTLFEIADMASDENHFTANFEDTEVLFSKGINQILDLKEFVNDPIIPRSISAAVGKFYNTSSSHYRYLEHS